MKKSRLFLLLALFALALSLCGCAAEEEAAQQAQGKTFVFGDTTFNAENGEPDINPHRDNSGWACIRYGVGETLLRFTDEMQLEPWLAETIAQENALTWRITLREGIRFSSGRILDAQAAKECLDALVQTHARAAGDLHIAAITAEGQTLTIRTEIPVPALPNFLADPFACIIDMDAGVGEDGVVVGTGPYKAVALVTDSRLELAPNSDYWNGTPKLDHITVRTISDGDTLTMALRSGEIDAAYGMPYVSYPLFENGDYRFTSCATSRTFFAAMNFDSPVTSDPAVRQAIALGIDKEGFAEALMAGNGEAAAGAFPANFSFGGDAVQAESYDPAAAAALLESAGWIDSDGDGVREKDGQQLVLRWLTYPSRQELPLLAESAQATLGAIGFDVEIQSIPDHNRIRADRSAWDIYASAMVTAPTGDPEYFFAYHCLDSSSNNDGAYHSAQLETLAAALSQTFDTEARSALAVEMQQVLLDDNAFVFCAHLRMSMIAKDSVTGLVAHPCDYYEISAALDKTE